MVYIMDVYVDGGCRGNGKKTAKGTAAAAFQTRTGNFIGFTKVLPSRPRPTNSRAELSAIILPGFTSGIGMVGSPMRERKLKIETSSKGLLSLPREWKQREA